jgi:hypothetical protein
MKNSDRPEEAGAGWEQEVSTQIQKDLAVKEISYKNYQKPPKKQQVPKSALIKNYPAKRTLTQLNESKSGKDGGRSDYLLLLKPDGTQRKIRVECRYQNSQGTATDKIAQLILDLKFFREDDEKNETAYIVVGGQKLMENYSAYNNLCKKLSLEGYTPSEVKVVTLPEFIKEIQEPVLV